jgi:hypothetical protein
MTQATLTAEQITKIQEQAFEDAQVMVAESGTSDLGQGETWWGLLVNALGHTDTAKLFGITDEQFAEAGEIYEAAAIETAEEFFS